MACRSQEEHPAEQSHLKDGYWTGFGPECLVVSLAISQQSTDLNFADLLSLSDLTLHLRIAALGLGQSITVGTNLRVLLPLVGRRLMHLRVWQRRVDLGEAGGLPFSSTTNFHFRLLFPLIGSPNPLRAKKRTCTSDREICTFFAKWWNGRVTRFNLVSEVSGGNLGRLGDQCDDYRWWCRLTWM